MGKIDIAVRNGILAKRPELDKVLARFLSDFNVSWGAERVIFNATLYSFIIKPTDAFAEAFGLEYELLLVYAPFEDMQARTMQAINSIFATEPAKGRVENLICIIVSDAPNAKEWVNMYTAEHQDLRTYVVFTKEEIVKCPSGSLLSHFRTQLSERDLFDVQLPLLDDLYFFGRQDILRTIQDNIKRCENSGVFGLRKTGKTSLLYKVKRTIEEAGIGRVFMYDAKNAKVRMRRWTELISLISEEISNSYGIPYMKDEEERNVKVVENFESIIKSVSRQERMVLIIDEIEYISFDPPLDEHWKNDYFNFWQLIWSMQSEYRNICFIIAGVNPQVTESSSVKTVQNPLFDIVKINYVHGLTRDEIHDMSRRIGRRMGLKFDYDAVGYLHKRYGGHPLLTRLALSYENQNAQSKPISFTQKMLIENEHNREEALIPYCQHIVDVLKDFYPEEYTLLEFLSIGETQDFIELSTSPLSITHLKSYGLLNYDNKLPEIGIPVVSSYIQRLISVNQGTQLARTIISVDGREDWLLNNIKSVISYMRQLEVAIRSNKSNYLFGRNSFPEAEKLLTLPVANSENEFKVFTSTLSNCFIESIVNYGKSINKPNYFWNDIKDEYTYLFEALLRIKAYRNWSHHLELGEKMQEIVDGFLYKDLETKKFCNVPDAYFVLQQCTIEALKLGISLEISNLS